MKNLLIALAFTIAPAASHADPVKITCLVEYGMKQCESDGDPVEITSCEHLEGGIVACSTHTVPSAG
jgi:hypothetical protein